MFTLAIFFVCELFLAKTQTNKNSCIESGCHEMVTRGWFKHAPVKEDCSTCHNFVKGKHPESPGREFELAAKIPDLCLNCHDIKKGDKSKHLPASEGECLTCHDPHCSDKRNLMVEDKNKVICLKCHDISTKDSVLHNPYKNGECSACHEAHYSKYEKLLKDESQNLCMKCHDKEIKGENKSIENIKKKISLTNVHEPVKSGCSVCHVPHSSKNKFLLMTEFITENYIFEKGKTGEMCFNCHPSEIISKDGFNETKFRDNKTNLHFLHVNRSKSRNCNICHDVHGSENSHLIKQYSNFNKWQLPINFSKNSTGGTCSPGCHQKVNYNNEIQSIAKTGERQATSNIGKISGYIKVDSLIDKQLIKGLSVNIMNSDSSFFETLNLDDNLKYERANLPLGKYTIALNTDDVELLHAKSKFLFKNLEINSQNPESLSDVSSFDLVFDSIPKMKIEPVPSKVNVVINKMKVFNYRAESSFMDSKGLVNYLSSVINLMKTQKKLKLSIVVHTDNTGTQSDIDHRTKLLCNRFLSHLVKQGIEQNRIYIQSKGALVPVQDNSTDKGRAANRRIEINILKK